MTPERWAQVNELSHRAMQIAGERRADFLDEACAADDSLRKEVQSPLTADDQAGSDFLHSPPHELCLDQTVGTGGPTPVAATDPSAWIGRRLGPYELIEKIGEGGMGEVYRGRRADGQYRKDVAINLVRAGFDSRLTVLASLDHPNITRLLDGGATEASQLYLVMESIQGVPLDEYCDQRTSRSVIGLEGIELKTLLTRRNT